MRLNVKTPAPKILTHEGASAARINPEQQLRRVVMASMLWEDTFYLDGISSADLIADAAGRVAPHILAKVAIEAREKQKLRHVPLFLVRELLRRKDATAGLAAKTIERVIQRPDELAELLAIYWRNGKTPLAAQLKKGLARAFRKFDAYSLAKYDREGDIKLRDVLFLVHARPKKAVDGYTKYARKKGAPAPDGSELFAALVNRTLESPDTWEVAISAAKPEEKKAEWTRLLTEGKLGALALLRNLRNMQQAGVDEAAIRAGLAAMKTERVLPFRFIAAARHAPRLEGAIEPAMLKCLGEIEKLPGKTSILVDVSTSMNAIVSGKSEITRLDAANGVAMLAREICETARVFAFNQGQAEIPPRRGFALRDAIAEAQRKMPDGTYINAAVQFAVAKARDYDRMILITDEQSHDNVQLVGDSRQRHYVINVGAYQNGVGYGAWHHIDGWSEACIDYIRAVESQTNA